MGAVIRSSSFAAPQHRSYDEHRLCGSDSRTVSLCNRELVFGSGTGSPKGRYAVSDSVSESRRFRSPLVALAPVPTALGISSTRKMISLSDAPSRRIVHGSERSR